MTLTPSQAAALKAIRDGDVGSDGRIDLPDIVACALSEAKFIEIRAIVTPLGLSALAEYERGEKHG